MPPKYVYNPDLPPIHRRKAHVIYSAVKPPIEIFLWNISTYEKLVDTLMRQLEGEIEKKDKIRRVQNLFTHFGNHRVWGEIKTDDQVMRMMNQRENIQMIVVVA